MNEDLFKVLFSGAVLILTFWGVSGQAPFLPSIQTGTTRTVPANNALPAQFKNQIYTAASAGLMAEQKKNESGSNLNMAALDAGYAPGQVTAPQGTGLSVQASVWLIGDLAKEENFAEFNPGKRWPIASITKLMTAVVAIENISKSKLVTISGSAVETEGAAGGFSAGEVMTSEDLLKAMMLVSSNDAAVALAEYLGQEKFIGLMNAKAVSLGMADTFFKEPTGLSTLNQSTVRDLKILVRYINATHPEILGYSRLASVKIFNTQSKQGRVLKNINLFSGRPDFLGGKTGYTDDAGENLVSLFSRNNRTIIIIVLDARDRFAESLSALQQFDRLNNR